jgi:sugar phosphate isomerase/epimerase
MKRRDVLAAGLAAGSLALLGAEAATAAQNSRRKFKLKYAPHFGMFKNHAGADPIDELKFMADQGFTALEDNGLKNRPVELQERIGRELARLGMEMGVFVATGDFRNVTFASNKPEAIEAILKDIRTSIDVAKRVNAKWATVVPGVFDLKREWE